MRGREVTIEKVWGDDLHAMYNIDKAGWSWGDSMIDHRRTNGDKSGNYEIF